MFITRFSYLASAIIIEVSESLTMAFLFFKAFGLKILLERGIQSE